MSSRTRPPPRGNRGRGRGDFNSSRGNPSNRGTSNQRGRGGHGEHGPSSWRDIGAASSHGGSSSRGGINERGRGGADRGGRARGSDRGTRGGDRGTRGGDRGTRGRGGRDPTNDGVGYTKIEEICKKLDEHRIISGEADLVTAVQKDASSFYNRFDELWPELQKQSNFLRVLVAAASTKQSDLLNINYEFVGKILSSTIINKIVDERIAPIAYDDDKHTAEYARLCHHMVKLLLLGFELLPTKMNAHLSRVQNVVTTIKGINTRDFKSDELTRDVGMLEVALKDRHKLKSAQHQPKAAPKQQQGDQVFQGSTGAPPSNFRSLSIVPTAEDINPEYIPYLRPNKDKGNYDDDEHYLDVQFRLLREDLHRPLRDGISSYKHARGGKRADLFVYKDLYLSPPIRDKKTGEMITYTWIKIPHRMRMDKRLIFGSLVCLSPDDFENEFIFGTVFIREDIKKGKIGFKFDEISKVKTDTPYKMAESPVFFEAYRHVMNALKEMEVPIPFSNYFVRVQTNTATPRYWDENVMDFKSIMKPNVEKTVYSVEEIRRQLNLDDFSMDRSQFEALKYALTSSLAIIQGPPGTGKTYIGLEIAKLLLKNWRVWNPNFMNDNARLPNGVIMRQALRDLQLYSDDSDDEGPLQLVEDEETFVYHDNCAPILVICYTNHALDQFLEGISKFHPDGIIRVGGQSRNEAMTKYNLCNVRYEQRTDLHRRCQGIRGDLKDTQISIRRATNRIKELETRLVAPSVLKSYVFNTKRPYYDSTRFFGSYDDFSKSSTMFKWLTQTDVKSFVDPYAIYTVQQLMEWKVPEMKAKNAVAYAYMKEDYFDATELFQKLRTKKQYKALPSHALKPDTPKWPRIADIKIVMGMGYNLPVAAEMLFDNTLENIRREHQPNQRGPRHRPQQRHLFDAEIANEAREELNGEVDIDDFEERNRIIVDDDKLLADIFKIEEKKNANGKKTSQCWYNAQILEQFASAIIKAQPMSEEEANAIEDVWKLPLQKRWQLYQYWIDKVMDETKDEIDDLEEAHHAGVRQYNEVRALADVQILKRAQVVGMTTTGAAKLQGALRALRPRIVIIEEAAEVLEAHLLSSLTRYCQHLILIGDHQQLRPNPAVYDLAIKYNLEVSLFERLINNKYPYRMLENQHRMCTDISRVLMPHFYKTLRDDPSVFEKEPVKGVTKNLMFINHSYPEEFANDIKSHKNVYEAKYCLALANYFIQQGYQVHQITILCAYMEQLFELRKDATAMFGQGHGCIIQCVDNYQGEENDIIILSLVRSNNPEKKIGFLKTSNRVCVALSRAKLGLYVLCNMDFLAQNCDLWKDIKKSAEKAGAVSEVFTVKCELHQNEQEITTFEDFEALCPEGGCSTPCNTRLECGHVCAKPCHPDDLDHKKYLCLKKCHRKCDTVYQHPCNKECFEDCGNCMHLVPKKLPCNHVKNAYCFLKPETITCDEPCRKLLPCSHACTKRCNQKCTTTCNKKVQRRLPGCEHIVEVKCCENINTLKCDAIVAKEWPFCKHIVKTKCSTDVLSAPCPKPCNTPLPDCNHLCKGSCGECRFGRLHKPCAEECKKILLCGHECESNCSKVCPPCSKSCETACGHSQCGKLPIPGEAPKSVRKLMDQKKKDKVGRKCGEPCPPCMEDCLNNCEHRRCKNKCGEACSVKPCNEPCQKTLPCDPHFKKSKKKGKKNRNKGEMEPDDEDIAVDESELHRCIGVCGSECPKICRICDPEKFAEIKEVFLGNEEDEDARFVQLKDCGHILEVTGLDHWIESLLAKSDTSAAVVQISCPKCKTPIRKSSRYMSILNERAMDTESIKQITRGLSQKEKEKEQNKFQKEADTVFKPILEASQGIRESDAIAALNKKLTKANPNSLTKNWFTISRNILKIVQTISKYENRAADTVQRLDGSVRPKPLESSYNVDNMKNLPLLQATMKELQIFNFWRHLKNEYEFLLNQLDPEMSETMLQQITRETQRFGFLVDLISYLSKVAKNSTDLKYAEIQMVIQIFSDLNGNKEFDGNFEKLMAQQLRKLFESHPVVGFDISPKERLDIIRALGAHVSHWYKCPNGHYYGIGDCGGAVMTAKCPECNAQIGGEQHRILGTNQDAQTEMLEGAGLEIQPYVNPFEVRFV